MRREVVGAQNLSRMCVVCGVDNELSLRGQFYELAGGELAGVFRPREEHQGYPNRMHGGLISAILDETIGRAINMNEAEAWGVTLEFTVRFRKPVPLDRPVKAIGRINGDNGRVFQGSGEIVLEGGVVAAEAEGKYLRLPLPDIAGADFTARDWFPDPASVPDSLDI